MALGQPQFEKSSITSLLNLECKHPSRNYCYLLLLVLSLTALGWWSPFPRHCATHQVRVILISCVVITSLLYPALVIYASSRPFSRFSSPLLDLPLGKFGSSHIGDLQDIWHGYEALKVRQDAAAKARCGFERTVRVERLLVASYRRDGVLNKPLLKKTLSLEQDISAQLTRKRTLPCVVLPLGQGGCFSTSPLIFWDHDDETLMNDPDILETMNHIHNDTLSKIPVHLPMVLAGRVSLGDGDKTDYGAYLVLTYYFRENDCQTKAGHDVWKALASEAVKGKGPVHFPPAQPRLLALQVCRSFSRSFLELMPVMASSILTWETPRLSQPCCTLCTLWFSFISLALSARWIRFIRDMVSPLPVLLKSLLALFVVSASALSAASS